MERISVFNKTNLRIGLVQGFYWMASCIFVSFLVRLLAGFGYSDYESGLALTICAFAALSMQPLLGRVADKLKNVGRLLILLFLLAMSGSIVLSFVHENRIASYLILFLTYGSFRSLIYLIDLWSYAVGEDDPRFSYGFTRSFGAAFYAISAVFFGYAIDLFSYRVIIPCFVVLSLVAATMVLLAPKPKERANTEEKKVGNVGETLLKLLKNKHYMFLLFVYLLMEMSAQPGQNYLTRKFEVLQAGEIFTGLSLLVMGLMQLPTLNNMDKLSPRFKPEVLVWVSLFGLFSRSIILGFSQTPIGTLCCFFTEPFAFGLYIGAILIYMRKHLPDDVRYFGMTLYSAITGGVGGMLGNYLSGSLAERFGILKMLKLMVIPSLSGVCLFTLALLVFKGEEE